MRAKWEPPTFSGAGSVGADVGGCLRTADHALSLWECGDDDASVGDVVLAFAAERDRADKMDVVRVSRDVLEKKDFMLVKTKGNTRVADLRDRHVDLVELTIDALGRVADVLAPNVRRNETCRRFAKAEVVEIVAAAVRSGRIGLDDLKPKLREAVKPRV